jgi:diguanylate cyclase (GGDEF)-like protein
VDPLTNVFNRAEFDRVHEELATKYAKNGAVYSVIICDLDHFKRINDTFGHQAGDEVLRKTAAALRETSRPDDLVARYGGEEFAILCPELGIAAATSRAEQVRNLIGRMEHPLLAGFRATASFGVTQVQPGDTAETTLRRADRALYLAKDQGRNRVIQLGMGAEEEKPVRRWRFWRRNKRSSPQILVEEEMIAPGPVRFALDKLRGFLADHQAVVKSAEENMLELEMIVSACKSRRKADLRQSLTMQLKFWEEMPAGAAQTAGNEVAEIRINVVVSQDTPSRRGDSRLTDHARQMIKGLRAYLMARMSPRWEDKNKNERRKILMPTLASLTSIP